jgi:hypothetical protein
VAKEIYRDTAERAREAGLSVDGAREVAGQLGDKIKTVVANAAGQQEADEPIHNTPEHASGVPVREKSMDTEQNNDGEGARRASNPSVSGTPLEKASRLVQDFKSQASGVAGHVTQQVREQASNLIASLRAEISALRAELQARQ